MKSPEGHWWVNAEGVLPCLACGCPVQRTLTGSIADGMAAHFKQCHPNNPTPTLPQRSS